MPKNFAICGGIAVGKTTLGRRLSLIEKNWVFLEEDPTIVPFINRFYDDKRRWAFHSRMGMLSYFNERSAFIEATSKIVLQDRSMHELIVFAEVQKMLGTMEDAEFELYQTIFHQLASHHPFPDVMIRCICDPDEAVRRISYRGRSFESAIDSNYLRLVEEAYDRWCERNHKQVEIITVRTDEAHEPAKLIEKLLNLT